MEQLALPFQHTRDSLEVALGRLSGRKIALTVTDNTSSMLSMRKEGRIILLRLHRMFLSADRAVLSEIAEYASGKASSTPILKKYISNNRAHIRRSTRKMKTFTQGKKYNLANLYHDLNREYFNGSIDARITWGARGPKRAAARRTLGSYCADDNTIRINPILDSAAVPRYFVQYIVYHEMLHADLGIGRSGKRRSIHGPEFKKREQIFRNYDRAIAWEKKRW